MSYKTHTKDNKKTLFCFFYILLRYICGSSMKIFVKYFLFLVSILTCCSYNFCRCSCCKKDDNALKIDSHCFAHNDSKVSGVRIILGASMTCSCISLPARVACEVCNEVISEEDCYICFLCNGLVKHQMDRTCFFIYVLNMIDTSSSSKSIYNCSFCNSFIYRSQLQKLFMRDGIFKGVQDEHMNKIREILSEDVIEEDVVVMSREELKASIMELNKGKTIVDTKPCPCCSTVISKTDATCNVVRCPECKFWFCWLCGFFTASSGDAHYHLSGRDCFIKGFYTWDSEDCAEGPYYGREYLFGKAAYQKPRFFMSGETRKNVYFVQHKKQFNEENYKIEYEIWKYDASGNKVEILSSGERL